MTKSCSSSIGSRIPGMTMTTTIKITVHMILLLINAKETIGQNNIPLTTTQMITIEPTVSPTILFSTNLSLSPTIASSLTPSIKLSSQPSLLTSQRPSISPSSFPSMQKSVQPTLALSGLPTIPLSNSPSISPTEIPSNSPSSLPTLDLKKSFPPSLLLSESPTFLPIETHLVTGLLITLDPLTPMNLVTSKDWEIGTSKYMTQFYNERETPIVLDVLVQTRFISQALTVPTRRNKQRRLIRSKNRPRQLQTELEPVQAGQLSITYEQTISYKIPPGGVMDPVTFVKAPFQFVTYRSNYIKELQSQNSAAFSLLQTASDVRIIDTSNDGDVNGSGVQGMLLIIIITSAFAVIVLSVIILLCWYRRRKKKIRKMDNIARPNMTSFSSETNMDSTPVSNGLRTTAIGEPIDTYEEEQSEYTDDYDFDKAYYESSTVSSAGGTMGDNTRLTSGTPALSSSLFTRDESYSNPNYPGGGSNDNVGESLIDIYAPPGKLGVVIDTPDEGAPVVHAIKDSSVIADKLKVGDQLIAVDDEDVRTMTAIKVSKMINRKSENDLRKLSIIRSTIIGS